MYVCVMVSGPPEEQLVLLTINYVYVCVCDAGMCTCALEVSKKVPTRASGTGVGSGCETLDMGPGN